MLQNSISVVACGAALAMTLAGAQAFDQDKYPDLKGQWNRSSGPQWDPSKPAGLGQQAPLTPEYQAIFEARLKEQAAGGQSYNPQVRCLPPGMPRAMIGYEPIEFIVTPETTYVTLVYMSDFRRIYTDGRAWPEEIEPTFAGYSIGKWIDSDGDGRYDTLEVETRGMKGPRIFDSSGLPMHQDNETVVKERIFLDTSNSNTLHDEVTTIDHALTRPWTVTRNFHREAKPMWLEYVCAENNNIVVIGNDTYYIKESDGLLAPSRPGQAPPDLRYFKLPAK